MDLSTLRIFSGNANPRLAEDIAAHLGVSTGRLIVKSFSDGEICVKVEESVRGMDVFIVQPTCHPVNDSIMELIILIDAFRRASARRITAVLPYYGYARQDKKIKPREPVTARLIANMITNAGAHRVLAVDLHAGQIQGFFDMPVDHLMAAPLIADWVRHNVPKDGPLAVVSPDVGGVPRARALAEMLNAQIVIVVKRRPEPNKSEVKEIIGDVEGRVCVMVDDMIDTAGSICSGAEALQQRGARRLYACCTHPVLSGDAVSRLEASPFEKVVVTDTIPLPEHKKNGKIVVLSVAPMLAEAVRRIHLDRSVSEMFDGVVFESGQ
ncbi:MAG: ribose-phosphate pyrophosphokinase [Armatimonadota bacterium]|nr:MAG: ribose-phosphate pyrophosphokinase [Armatimonadota bacterium]